MKIKKTLFAVGICAGLFSVTSAHAVLTLSVDGNTVYDSDLDITWLQNADLATTNTFGLATDVDLGPITGVNTYTGSYIWSDGRMTWGGALHWINAMNAYNGTGYLGYNDWRLPTTADIGNNGYSGSGFDGTGDYGYNVTSSEMGHLYYTELGNLGYVSTSGSYPQPGWGLTNTGPFSNVQSDYYWSGTEYAPGALRAWYFYTRDGGQHAAGKNYSMYAWAVRDGGAPVSAVPEPEAYAMLFAGLGLLSFTARRRKQNA